MYGVRTNVLSLAHQTVPLHCLRVILLAGLVVLLMAGCQETVTSENSDREAVSESSEKTADPTGQMPTEDTFVDENERTSDPTAQTLGLLTKLIENSEVVLRKLAGEQAAYANAGDAQGERLMAQAADDTRDIKTVASSLQRDIEAVDSDTGQYDEPAYQPRVSNSQLAQEKVEAIEESTDQLEENIAEARYCCELPADFLDKELRELRAQTNSIEALIAQIEFDQPPTESTAPPTTPPTAQPTAESTEQP